MSTGSIDRVQSDLNAMRDALGMGPIWNIADVRFGYALAASCAVGLVPLAWLARGGSDALGWVSNPADDTRLGSLHGSQVANAATAQAVRRREYHSVDLWVAMHVHRDAWFSTTGPGTSD